MRISKKMAKIVDEYSKYVDGLAAPKSMENLHTKITQMALGLSGEIGEFSEIIIFLKNKHTTGLEEIFNTKKEDLKKEISDVIWYISFGCTNVLEIKFSSLFNDLENWPSVETKTIRELIIMANSECAKNMIPNSGYISDLAKKILFHEMEYTIDVKVKMVLTLQSILKSIAFIGKHVLDCDVYELIKVNEEKLRSRYKGDKFSVEEFRKKEESE